MFPEHEHWKHRHGRSQWKNRFLNRPENSGISEEDVIPWPVHAITAVPSRLKLWLPTGISDHALFADLMADHTTNRSASCRSDTAAAGQYRAAYSADAGADCRIFVAPGHIAASAQHGQCTHRNGNDCDPVNCSHDDASVKK